MASSLIKNIGIICSGDINHPLLDGDALLIEDGLIKGVGKEKELDGGEPKTVIDARGTTLAPGLIDSHVHPVFGDFTPRQNVLGYIESYLHGGVTSMVSNGEVHLAGRPRDRAGVKALAILAAKSFANSRPGGVKVLGGTMVLESGLLEEDFAEVAREGVRCVKFLTEIENVDEAKSFSRWAKKYGVKVIIHCGGASLPGVKTTTADSIIQIEPDVVAHINGGPTSVSLKDMEKLIRQTPYYLDIVNCGNPKAALEAIKIAMDARALGRVIIGTDTPSGSGVIPLGMWQTIVLLASLTELKAEEAIALATGNTARAYGLKTGMIKEGNAADLVIMDAPSGCIAEDALGSIKNGDIPGISIVLIDGEVKVSRSRNTPPPKRPAVII